MTIALLLNGTYQCDSETCSVQNFTCTSHVPAHIWKYVKTTAGIKTIVEFEMGMPQECPDFDGV